MLSAAIVCFDSDHSRGPRGEIYLVENADDRALVSLFPLLAACGGGVVDDQYHDIGFGHLHLRPRNAFLLNGVGGMTNPRCIGKLDRHTSERYGLPNDIARSARNVGDNRDIIPSQMIE